MNMRALRVAVVGAVDGRPAHPALADSTLDVIAEVRELSELLSAPSHEHEAALVGCSPAQLADPRFQSQLARLSRSVPTVLVVPRITRRAATVAARARAYGLVTRDCSPEELSRTVRTVVHGRIAYPPAALAVILRLLPPLSGHRASLHPTT